MSFVLTSTHCVSKTQRIWFGPESVKMSIADRFAAKDFGGRRSFSPQKSVKFSLSSLCHPFLSHASVLRRGIKRHLLSLSFDGIHIAMIETVRVFAIRQECLFWSRTNAAPPRIDPAASSFHLKYQYKKRNDFFSENNLRESIYPRDRFVRSALPRKSCGYFETLCKAPHHSTTKLS